MTELNINNPRLSYRDKPRTDVKRVRVEVVVESTNTPLTGLTADYAGKLYKRGTHIVEVYEDELHKLEALVEDERGRMLWEQARENFDRGVAQFVEEKLRGATGGMTPLQIQEQRELLAKSYPGSPEAEFHALTKGTGRHGRRPLKSIRILERGLHPLSDAHTATVREVISHLGVNGQPSAEAMAAAIGKALAEALGTPAPKPTKPTRE